MSAKFMLFRLGYLPVYLASYITMINYMVKIGLVNSFVIFFCLDKKFLRHSSRGRTVHRIIMKGGPLKTLLFPLRTGP